MRKKVHNRGSSVIEMTLLMPIILGVLYLYIGLFLFFVDSSKQMKNMTEALYCTEEENGEQGNICMVRQEQGSKLSVSVTDTTGMFNMDLELHRNDDSIVKNIRRWQLATDTIRKRGNE